VDLANSGGRVACITYTNVAKDEIREWVGADPLIVVATIHEFLWAEIERSRTRCAWRSSTGTMLPPTPQDLTALTADVRISYVELGRNLAEERISHDDGLALSHQLVSNSPKLVRIIVDRFPYILVDEYQDTSPPDCGGPTRSPGRCRKAGVCRRAVRRLDAEDLRRGGVRFTSSYSGMFPRNSGSSTRSNASMRWGGPQRTPSECS
jgi:hypothetical protein